MTLPRLATKGFNGPGSGWDNDGGGDWWERTKSRLDRLQERRLCTPREANGDRETIHQWLTAREKPPSAIIPKSARCRIGGQAGNRTDSPIPQVPPTPRAQLAPQRLLQVTLPGSGTGPFESEAGDPEPVKPLSAALRQRRKVHPRLRWARLAKDGEQTSPGFATSSTGEVKLDENRTLQEPRFDDDELFKAACKQVEPQPIVVGPGSVFYAGIDEPQAWPWPPWSGQSSIATASRSSSPLGVAAVSSTKSKRAVLPKPGTHTEAVVGSVATARSSAPGKNPRTSNTSEGSEHKRNPSKGSTLSMCTGTWHMRQVPVSGVMAHKAKASAKATSGSKGSGPVIGKFFDFGNWSLDDAYVISLLGTTETKDLREVERVDLSENRLTNLVVEALADISENFHSLKVLSLANNHLGTSGGVELARFLASTKSSIAELDVAGNLIGDRALSKLCGAIGTACRASLTHLNLSRNELGHSAEAGQELGHMISSMRALISLDLQWNRLHGPGGTAVCEGLYDNNVNLGGQLRRVDLSWNMLGQRCKHLQAAELLLAANPSSSARGPPQPSTPGGSQAAATAVPCNCSICVTSTRTARMLAALFQEGTVLFHLDLSYNGFGAAACQILANGLRKNHTLFGIHLLGNEASVDDQGFILPWQPGGLTGPSMPAPGGDAGGRRPRGVMAAGPPLGDEDQQLVLNDYLTNANDFRRAMEKKSGDESKPEAVALSDAFQAVQRNRQCCWICDKWIEQRVFYIPGFSGPERSLDEAQAVFAFFSIDGFSRGTRLTRTEEPYTRRTFANEGHAHMSSRHNRLPQVPRTEDGKVVKFVGSRMLPPSSEPLEIVFQVNGQLVAANHLSKRELKLPKMVQLETIGVDGKILPWFVPSAEEGGEPAGLPTVPVRAVAETGFVNAVQVAMTALEQFHRGDGASLIILEDPAKRGEAAVFPRRRVSMVVAVEEGEEAKEPWSFEKSTFTGFVQDGDKVVRSCFDSDWKLSRLGQFCKDPVSADLLCDYLRPRYRQLMLVWNQHAFFGFNSLKTAAGMTSTEFGHCLNAYTTCDFGENWLFNGRYTRAEADTAFIAANVISMDKDKRNLLKAFPERGLARFQFLEAIVRVCARRFLDSGEQKDLMSAVEAFMNQTHFGEDMEEIRRSLHNALFTEECSEVFQEHRGMLEALYDSYKCLYPYPGRGGRGLTFGAWRQLLQDAESGKALLGQGPASPARTRVFGSTLDLDSPRSGGLRNWSPNREKVNLAFALGRELRIDDLSSFRTMELSLQEFFVAIGTLVRLQCGTDGEHFEPDALPQDVADFISEHLTAALHQRAAVGGGTDSLRKFAQDESVKPVLVLVQHIFEEADEDGSKLISAREFRKCCARPEIMEEMAANGFEVGDLNVLFRQIDRDGSGEVSLEELCEAFLTMKQQLKSDQDAVRFFRKVFTEHDEDGSGTLDRLEFRDLCGDKNISKRMQSLGISMDDMELLWDTIDCDGSKEISVDEFIAAFLHMRDPSSCGTRGMSILKAAFAAADVDKSGSLTRAEVEAAFCGGKISAQLVQQGLTEPDWLGVFDALDLNGDGLLSWEELRQGMTGLWSSAVPEPDAPSQEASRKKISTRQARPLHRRASARKW